MMDEEQQKKVILASRKWLKSYEFVSGGSMTSITHVTDFDGQKKTIDELSDKMVLNISCELMRQSKLH